MSTETKLTWTRTPPEKEGWYLRIWDFQREGNWFVCCKVFRDQTGGLKTVSLTGMEAYVGEFLKVQWAGPIEFPENFAEPIEAPTEPGTLVKRMDSV